MTRLVSTALAILIAAAIVGLGLFIKRTKFPVIIYTRITAGLLALVTFARYIYMQPPVYYLVSLVENPEELAKRPSYLGEMADKPFLVLVAVLLVWFVYSSMLSVVTGEFFKFKTLDKITTCFSLPVYVMTLVAFDTYVTGALGSELNSLSVARVWFIAIEAGLAIGLILFKILYRTYDDEKIIPPFHSAKDVFGWIYALVASLLVTMPCFIPQALIGFIDPSIKLYDYTEGHRFMIYFSFIIPFIIYHLLKNKPQDVKRFAMIYGTLGLLWVYLGKWNLNELLTDPRCWPLHLCNTAMFIVPICLIFRMNKLFTFCLFINVLGAMMAMIIPGELNAQNALSTARVSFWINHYVAFATPVMLVALKIFKRPKFKEWIYSVIALTVYFFSILFINGYLSAAEINGTVESTDFFFVNSDFIVSGLGEWAEKTMDTTWVITFRGVEMTFYPVYQTLFYVTYIGFTIGMWFLYALIFTSWDKAEDRRLRERDYKRMKKELNEYLGGRSTWEPASGDCSPRIAIKHFCKRYGSNTHYSVNDVTFTVNGGEIFGFLGPNGAGKSTIIKSMVGIQTITSGNIEICGYDAEKQPVMAKLNTGFVPDHYALYENLTGREYVNYIADLFQVGQKERDARIEKYVERFQLVGSIDNQMKTYSHGMKQKITIMSALVHNPKVWILDEPLTGLDPTSIHEVKECMKEHAAHGNIVFFSSHIIDVVEKICDRIAIIKKGKLRAVTTIAELNRRGIELEKFYLSIINSDDETVASEFLNTEAGAV